MITMTLKEYETKGRELFGDDPNKFRFKCPSCQRVQSAESVKEQIKAGIPSKRYGLPEKGDVMFVEQACYSPDCNWVANGLFSGPILIVIDPEKPHDRKLLKNCTHAFEFDEEKGASDEQPSNKGTKQA